MAGVYIAIGSSSQARLQSVSKYLRFSNESEVLYSVPEFGYCWQGHDDKSLYAPAWDPGSGVHCITSGRLCLAQKAWHEASALPYEGGMASRVALKAYLESGEESVAPFNGAAAICIWDPSRRQIHLWTDQFGYHPLFISGQSLDEPTVVTSFPDALLADSEIELQPDLVSMAEFLRAWRTTPPHTYYQNVKYVGAAAHWCIRLGHGVLKRTYWSPFEHDPFPNIHDAADQLAASLKLAVQERTQAARRPVFFISGGADSRVMLFAAADPRRVHGINLFERPTEESRIAKSLCERVGATYVPFQRDNDYYPRLQQQNVRWSGAMWCSEDNHYLGVQPLVSDLDADLVMTACTTDWLFKGYGLERTYQRFLGKNLPLRKFTHERIDGFLPNVPGSPPDEFAEQIRERMDVCFQGCPRELRHNGDYLKVEDRRVRPACYTVSVSGPIMYRIYPYDTFLADSRVADCYARIKAAWKLNGDVWGLAAGKVCSSAQDIVDSNYGWAVNAGRGSKLLAFSKGWLRRRLTQRSATSDSNTDHPPSHASWPDFGWYVRRSPTLTGFWNDTSLEHRDLMYRLTGTELWSISLDEWSSNAPYFFRVLTLLQHWRNRDQLVSRLPASH